MAIILNGLDGEQPLDVLGTPPIGSPPAKLPRPPDGARGRDGDVNHAPTRGDDGHAGQNANLVGWRGTDGSDAKGLVAHIGFALNVVVRANGGKGGDGGNARVEGGDGSDGGDGGNGALFQNGADGGSGGHGGRGAKGGDGGNGGDGGTVLFFVASAIGFDIQQRGGAGGTGGQGGKHGRGGWGGAAGKGGFLAGDGAFGATGGEYREAIEMTYGGTLAGVATEEWRRTHPGQSPSTPGMYTWTQAIPANRITGYDGASGAWRSPKFAAWSPVYGDMSQVLVNTLSPP